MLVMTFIQWWYGPGWNDTGHRIATRIKRTYLGFSIPILARTLFAPWRRIVTPPGGSMQDKLRAYADNAVSRAVGFMVRLFTLIAALVSILVEAIFGGLILAIWPFAPLLGPALIVGGIL